MNKKSQFYYYLAFGAVIIAASIFFSVKYLMKGSPVIKVMAFGLIAAAIYFVVTSMKSKFKNKDNE